MPNEPRETLDFKQFLRLNPAYQAKPWTKSESPDFLIKIDGTIVGFEHTQLLTFEGIKRLRKQEGRRDLINYQARKIVEKASPDLAIEVRVLFNLNNTPPGSKNSDMSNELAAIVLGYTAGLSDRLIRLDIDNTLPDWMSSIYLATRPNWEMARWGPVEAGIATVGGIERITEAIREKNEKVPRYRESCDRIVLLLAAGHRPSGFVHADDTTLEHVFSSAFDETYLLDSIDQNLYKLKTLPPAKEAITC
jgi:hypothetical protein